MESLQEQVDALMGMLERQKKLAAASYALHSTLDLGEILDLILTSALDGVSADRGTVFLKSSDGKTLWSKVLSGDRDLEIRLPVGHGIAGSVGDSGETVMIEDAYHDPRFDSSWDEKSGYRTRGMLCTPIRNRDREVVGVFQLLNKIDGVFSPDDVEFLDGLSVPAALAIENARLHLAEIEKERQEREIGLAHSIQRQLQPERFETEAGGIRAAGMNEL